MIKLKGSFALWLCLIGGSVITLILFSAYFFKTEAFTVRPGENPWDIWFVRNYNSLPVLLLPFFVILLTALITQLEHKSSALKHILSLPLPKGFFYFGKYFVILLLIGLTHILFDLWILGGAYLLGFLRPTLNFALYDPDWFMLLRLSCYSFFSILGIASIHYWISVRFRNFIIPVTVGLMGLVITMIVFNWDKSKYIPYSHSFRLSGLNTANTIEEAMELSRLKVYNLIYFVLPLALGFLEFRRMNVR